MPENYTEKPKFFEFFKIEKQGETLIIELTSERLNRSTAAEFRRQLTDQTKSKRPSSLIIDLAGLDLGDEMIGAILFTSREMSISKENFILCGASEGTKFKLRQFGVEEILTIKDTADI